MAIARNNHLKPQRQRTVLNKFSAAQIARLRVIFSTGVWYGAKVRAAIKQETGILIGCGSIHKMFMHLSDRALGSGNAVSAVDELMPEKQALVKGWFKADPRLSYREVCEKIKADFGLPVSQATVRNWWLRQTDLVPSRPPKTVELSIVVRDGDKVESTTIFKMPLSPAS